MHGASSVSAPGVNGNGVSEGGFSDRPLSRYDLETCLAYVRRCKEEGEHIGSVYALARYLHKTGDQDEMISIVLGLGAAGESGGVVAQGVPPFGLESLPDSPQEIQDETDIDQ